MDIHSQRVRESEDRCMRFVLALTTTGFVVLLWAITVHFTWMGWAQPLVHPASAAVFTMWLNLSVTDAEPAWAQYRRHIAERRMQHRVATRGTKRPLESELRRAAQSGR